MPAAVSGTDRLLRLGKLRVAYGRRSTSTTCAGSTTHDAAQQATDRLMERIYELEASL